MQIQLNDQVRVYFDRPRRRSDEVERIFSAGLPQREPPINMLLECKICETEEKISEYDGLRYYLDLETGRYGQHRKQEYLDWINSYEGKVFRAAIQQQRDFIKMLKTCAGDSGGRSREFTFCDGQNTVTVNAVFRDICSISSKQDVLWGRFIVDKMPDFIPSYFELHLD